MSLQAVVLEVWTAAAAVDAGASAAWDVVAPPAVVALPCIEEADHRQRASLEHNILWEVSQLRCIECAVTSVHARAQRKCASAFESVYSMPPAKLRWQTCQQLQAPTAISIAGAHCDQHLRRLMRTAFEAPIAASSEKFHFGLGLLGTRFFDRSYRERAVLPERVASDSTPGPIWAERATVARTASVRDAPDRPQDSGAIKCGLSPCNGDGRGGVHSRSPTVCVSVPLQSAWLHGCVGSSRWCRHPDQRGGGLSRSRVYRRCDGEEEKTKAAYRGLS